MINFQRILYGGQVISPRCTNGLTTQENLFWDAVYVKKFDYGSLAELGMTIIIL